MLAICQGRAFAADYYLISQGPQSFVFANDGAIVVPDSGLRATTVITIFEGPAIADHGYKILLQELYFSCRKKLAFLASETKYSPDGHPLTPSAPFIGHPVELSQTPAEAYAFVCDDLRTYTDYYEENPLQAADQRFALGQKPK
jgi:hypothetical protein